MGYGPNGSGPSQMFYGPQKIYAIRAIQLDLNAVNIQALITHKKPGEGMQKKERKLRKKSINKTKSVVWPVSVA